jgi:hypothetical protein
LSCNNKKVVLIIESRNEPLQERGKQIMAQNELLDDTSDAPELDELEAPEADLDDFGDEEIDDDFDGLSSDLDRWKDDEDLYGGYSGYSDYDYINGLIR